MSTYATPGVYFEAVDTAPPPVAALRTDVAVFLGIAERGPLHRAVRVASWEQFAAVFGGFVAQGYLAYAVKGFFENGGRACWIVRVASREATCAGAVVLGGTTPVLRATASSEGTWGDRLAVRLRLRVAAATRTTGVQPGDGRTSVVDGVAGFGRADLVRLVRVVGDGTLESFRVVARVDASRSTIHWREPFDAQFVGAELSLEVWKLDLTVYEDARMREELTGLSLVPDHPRYLGSTVAAESRLVALADLRPPALDLPWVHALAATALDSRLRPLTGGVDGLRTLAPGDFTGLPRDELVARGFAALEHVDEPAIVCAPDIHAQPVVTPEEPEEQPAPEPDPCLPAAPREEPPPPLEVTVAESAPGFDTDEVATVQQALVEHCELLRDRVAILDPPAPLAGDAAGIEQWRRRFDSSFAALYFPWLDVYDPLRLGGRVVRRIPPSGHVAGAYAAGDIEVGVHRAPANRDLQWAADVAVAVDAELQGVLNPLGVNCVRPFPGRGVRVYGARTMSSDTSWRFVNVRRLMLMIEKALERALQWAVFEPNDAVLRSLVTLSISGFLDELWRRGALVGARPEEAYFVRCDDVTTPADAADRGELVALVGVAPVRPAEFVVFRISRTEDRLEVSE